MARLALLVVLLLGCDAGAPPVQDPTVPFVTLKRWGCFWGCPVYTVDVYPSGDVLYNGVRNVKTIGPARWVITKSKVDALHALFRTNGFANMESSYREQHRSDGETIDILYRAPGTKAPKAIEYYDGDMTAPREALGAIELGIDDLVDIDRVIGTFEERKNLPHPDAERLRRRREAPLTPECEANPLGRGCL